MPLSDEKSIRTLQILAPTIRDHKQFEMKLASAPPELRTIIYEACVPLLPFRAHPLGTYLSRAAQRAEREQLPTIGDKPGELQPFRSAVDLKTAEHANDVLAASIAARTLTLVCAKCRIEHVFYRLAGETSSDTIRRARQRGWVYDYKADPVRELCPRCAN